jgi:hypothetical protein
MFSRSTISFRLILKQDPGKVTRPRYDFPEIPFLANHLYLVIETAPALLD